MRFLDVKLGQIVVSRAGRDKGKFFIVAGIENELYLYISDGSLRKVEKPKKKKVKHLKLTDEVVSPISEKLEKKLKVNNSEIRKSLAEYQNRVV